MRMLTPQDLCYSRSQGSEILATWETHPASRLPSCKPRPWPDAPIARSHKFQQAWPYRVEIQVMYWLSASRLLIIIFLLPLHYQSASNCTQVFLQEVKFPYICHPKSNQLILYNVDQSLDSYSLIIMLPHALTTPPQIGLILSISPPLTSYQQLTVSFLSRSSILRTQGKLI